MSVACGYKLSKLANTSPIQSSLGMICCDWGNFRGFAAKLIVPSRLNLFGERTKHGIAKNSYCT